MCAYGLLCMTQRGANHRPVRSFRHLRRRTCLYQHFPNTLDGKRHHHRHLVQLRRVEQHYLPLLGNLTHYPAHHPTRERDTAFDGFANPGRSCLLQ